MRSVLILLAILLTPLLFCGCSGQGENAANTAASPTAPAQPAQGAAPATESAAPSPAAQPAAAAGAGPEAVREIPVFPGATIAGQEAESREGGWASATEVKLTTTADFQSVRDFYDNIVKTGGWQVVTFQDRPNKAYWKLAKGTATEVDIEVEASRTAGVRVKIERKDR